eukprot:5480548-Ditylum_brightwellii.AAC.1
MPTSETNPSMKQSNKSNAKNPLQHGKPKRELDYQRKSLHLAVMPSPKVKSILLNHHPQVI